VLETKSRPPREPEDHRMNLGSLRARRFRPEELRDIGCSQADAHREINKPFWRA
jgi:uncharacterized protein YjiS (DUF1127 family)